MRLQIRRIGNSQGVIFPQSVLAQAGLQSEVEAKVKAGSILLTRPERKPREGWVDECKALADAGEDQLVWPDFANEADQEIEW